MGLGLPSRVPTGTRSSSRSAPRRHPARELGAPRAGPGSRLSGRGGLTRRRHGASGGKPHARSLPHAAAPRDGSSGRDSRAGSRPASPAGFGGGRTPPASGGSFFLSGQREANRGRSAGPQRLWTEYTRAGTALTKSPPAFAHPCGAPWTMPGLPRRLPPSPAPLELPQAHPEPPQELDAAGNSFIEVHALEGALFPARSQHKGHRMPHTFPTT